MDARNLLRLTDESDGPIQELRVALSDVLRALRRTLREGLERSAARGVARSLFQRRLTIVETGNQIVVTAALPGTGAESITVTLSSGNVLRIKVPPRRNPAGNGSGRGRRRSDRSFDSSLVLDEKVARDGATAVFENGKLTVRLPKRPAEEVPVAVGETKAA